jgi:hypothetical protein
MAHPCKAGIGHATVLDRSHKLLVFDLPLPPASTSCLLWFCLLPQPASASAHSLKARLAAPTSSLQNFWRLLTFELLLPPASCGSASCHSRRSAARRVCGLAGFHSPSSQHWRRVPTRTYLLTSHPKETQTFSAGCGVCLLLQPMSSCGTCLRPLPALASARRHAPQRPASAQVACRAVACRSCSSRGTAGLCSSRWCLRWMVSGARGVCMWCGAFGVFVCGSGCVCVCA